MQYSLFMHYIILVSHFGISW